MILLDTSAETIDRAAMYIYEKNIQQLTLQDRVIKFNELHSRYKNLNNGAIAKANQKLMTDILNILCYASQSKEFSDFYTFQNCKLALLAGNHDLLEQHLLSLIVRSNSQIKQKRAVDFGNQLEKYIKKSINPTLTELQINYAHDSRYNGQQFDIVLQKNDKHAIIEIAFQETTNSVLERKGKQAKNGLFEQIDKNGDRLIFVVDGAGYFKRTRALNDLITYSHLTCNVSQSGLNQLIQFLKEYF